MFCGAWALRLHSQLAFDTPTGSVHVLGSGGGPVSVGQLTGGGVWWPLRDLLCFLGCPGFILSHLGSALLCFRRGFLIVQSSTVPSVFVVCLRREFGWQAPVGLVGQICVTWGHWPGAPLRGGQASCHPKVLSGVCTQCL